MLFTDANVCVDQQVLSNDGINRQSNILNSIEPNMCVEQQRKTVDNVCISELYPPTNITSVSSAGTGARPNVAQSNTASLHGMGGQYGMG